VPGEACNSIPAFESSRPIRTAPRGRCYLCNAAGTPLYRDLCDRHWNVGGRWNLRQCVNRECRLVWLDPSPLPEDIPLMYSEYFTHDGPLQGRAEKLRNTLLPFVRSRKTFPRRSGFRPLLWALARVSAFRDFSAGALMWLQDSPPGEVLDFGFGAGQLLTRLRNLGWQVSGVEFDPEVLATARETLKIDARSSVLKFPANRFDVIAMSHVIEHLPDPIATLRECAGRLKPGGRMILATPNMASLGHKRFRANWRPLDPPRHLFLFSPDNLARCVERVGLEVEKSRTSARSACFSWYSSKELVAPRRSTGADAKQEAGPILKMAGAIFQLWEHYAGGAQGGEEIILTARRPAIAGVASR
jgi:2-polyprenyl-3-methyl-5-hydroxy-6-metoxy-1,4-benzoquinol methylase